MDNERYNDPRSFPDPKHIQRISMELDGSLEVSVLRNDERMHYHGSISCPPGTKLFDYLLTISGPLKPGQTRSLIQLTPDGSKVEVTDTDDIDEFDFFKPKAKKIKKQD